MNDERPGMSHLPDDLDQAYARSHALADDGRAPSSTVRANVLAAARDIAAQAAARAATERAAPTPLTPVAPPVSAVGRGRGLAINLSSWRVRSGAALCAVLLVGLASWRFDASRRFGGEQLVASLDKEAQVSVVAPPPPPPKDLAYDLPRMAAAPAPAVIAPPQVALDAAAASPAPEAEKPAAPAKDVVVAQAERSDRALGLPPAEGDARVHVNRARPLAKAAPEAANASPAPVVVASAEPDAEAAPAPAPAPATAPGTARFALAAPPAPAPAIPPIGETPVAAAQPEPQRLEITGSRILRVDEASKKSAASASGTLIGASARQLPAPLQAAVDRGDIEALKTLLADSATRVDAPDAAGRTALLHAVVAQQVLAVRLLLAAGADPGRADHAGLTPRAAAQSGANAEIAALLAAPR